ncbi:hypothetical protein AJ80_07757 [Polytolypa hystricis UAMH7299]|uniref:Sin3 binding protein n=1 Tax=Polytolypa hystricis (strain UAMH7299) TaxID=1447883 RepID=A0A2B7XIP7_POLH7|nr:hypothetical protein AJ80_07757 [Polytolypa hystricis UAMH7299]
MANQSATSSIAMALAGKTQSVDIPKPRGTVFPAGRDNLTAVPAQPGMLPTPPNSVSPALHPHFKHHPTLPDSPPCAPLHVDSDVDLQDAANPANGHKHTPLVAEALSGLNSTDAITPGMLAKHHLPEILLSHGPLAIRHIISFLTTSVPGFSRVPPAKARRIVVAALEGRGNGGEGGGVAGDVEFEKVGWGRWDACRRGQTAQNINPAQQLSPPEPTQFNLRGAVPIPNDRAGHDYVAQYGSPIAGGSAVFSHSDFDYGEHEDVSMLEHEADKMSLDGDNRYCSSSEAQDDDLELDVNWDEADLTDEENWAQIGAAALRARSIPNGSGGGHHVPKSTLAVRSKGSNYGYGGDPPYSVFTKPVPHGLPVQNSDFLFPNGVGGFEERAAVEALLQLGSM